MTRYLDRLGVDRSAPSPSALRELHRAHVELVPYETFWLHLGEGWGITPADSLRRIAVDGRGGYCFHLNPAFAELLDWLGYTVNLHTAGVYDPNGPTRSTIGNHVALTVDDLPDGSNPGGSWYLDTGLGDGLHEPLPLVPGTSAQGPTMFTVGGADGVGSWSVRASPAGSFSGVSIMEQPVAIDAFHDRHEFNATSPRSSFAATVTAQRRSASCVEVLRGCVLTSRRIGATSTHTFDHCSDWLDTLDDTFGLRFAVSRDAVDHLWSRVRAAHRSWLETSAARTNGS